jgi:hypothetical protein
MFTVCLYIRYLWFFDSGEHLLYIAGGSYYIDWGDEQLHRWLLDCGLLGGHLVFHAMTLTHLFPAPWRRCPAVMFLPSSMRPGGERAEARSDRILWPSEHMYSHVLKVVKTHQTTIGPEWFHQLKSALVSSYWLYFLQTVKGTFHDPIILLP